MLKKPFYKVKFKRCVKIGICVRNRTYSFINLQIKFNKKEVTKSGEAAKFLRREFNDLTESYKRFMTRDTLLDFAVNVLQVSDSTYNERYFILKI